MSAVTSSAAGGQDQATQQGIDEAAAQPQQQSQAPTTADSSPRAPDRIVASVSVTSNGTLPIHQSILTRFNRRMSAVTSSAAGGQDQATQQGIAEAAAQPQQQSQAPTTANSSLRASKSPVAKVSVTSNGTLPMHQSIL